MKKEETKTEAKFSLESQKELAKIGMGISLALTATTALFMNNPSTRKIHIISGAALIGFSIWHYSLYPKEKAIKNQKA
ncbi:hypothetical protein [Campylobacter troglodytis]|uniref:hypothetical protein n=1 Tax=Campylobacter troglodytis TaxID=654363 RepID=UPI001157EA18|nr:hypothetical protein [Campylobacter troglodytis]TQR60367.1 hypothetical protein DMC01_06065 [Campylobacter troglodytis]